MYEVANRKTERWLDVEHINKFPYEDLRTIDQLWVHYSNGRFGLSVQKEIYLRLGGTRRHNEKIWQEFCEAVGWRKGEWSMSYSDPTFNLQDNTAIPQPQYGHFPSGKGVSWLGHEGKRGTCLAYRLVDLNI